MSDTNDDNGTPDPERRKKRKKDRIDVDPPYGGHVNRLRRLLAELIARRILAERNRPPRGGSEPRR